MDERIRCHELFCMLFITAVIPIVARNKTITKVVRFHEMTPPNTTIFDVSSTFVNQGKTNLTIELTGPDKEEFLLYGFSIKLKNALTTSRRKPRRVYRTSINVLHDDHTRLVVVIIHLKVIMSEKNRHPPRFLDGNYTAEVYRFAAINSPIMEAEVRDADVESYNRRVVYRISAFQRERPQPLLVTTNENTAVVKTTAEIRNAGNSNTFKLTAINYAASPKLYTSSFIRLFVREFKELKGVDVKILNKTSIEVCWQNPLKAGVTQIKIAWTSITEQTLHRTVLKENRLRQCSQLDNLQLAMNNPIELQAANGTASGMTVRIFLVTSLHRNICIDDFCEVGRCLATQESYAAHCRCASLNCQQTLPCTKCHSTVVVSCQHGGNLRDDGTCTCPKGYHGSQCEIPHSCLQRNAVCHNGATCQVVSPIKYHCVCAKGFIGQTCSDPDPCDGLPCQHAISCERTPVGGVRCHCKIGYYGSLCERFDPCSTAPCQNNAICRNNSDIAYTCECASGFIGTHCDVYMPCAQEPCLNGGFCNSIDGRFFCHCRGGHFGERCEHVNLCDRNKPCDGGAVACHNISDTNYACICKPGWFGRNCSSFDPCLDQPCLSGGTCTITFNRSYSCICKAGFNGSRCEHKDHCFEQPCLHGATCTTSQFGYSCECTKGYFGTTCANVNPCYDAKCLNNAKCVNFSTTEYECNCANGYYGDLCQFENTCLSNPCQHGKCRLLRGEIYRCDCFPGFNGSLCEHHFPCLSYPCKNEGSCVPTWEDNYDCLCQNGYYGIDCSYYDICSKNPCHTGTCLHTTSGEFTCNCTANVYGEFCHSIDPCISQPCNNGGSCVSVFGASQYTCACKPGFSGNMCEKYTTCTHNPCQNGARCTLLHKDSNEEFVCHCKPGFTGITCTELTSCEMYSCKNGGTCTIDVNGGVCCACADGYDGTKCEYQNACYERDSCQNGGTCLRHHSSHSRICVCPSGFFGENCQRHNPCADNTCQNNATCVHTLDENFCICAPGFTGSVCEDQIGECASVVCANDGTCEDDVNGYICICAPGYLGTNCQNTDVCKEDKTFDEFGYYVWPATQYGKATAIACARGPEGAYVTRICSVINSKVSWEFPNGTLCDIRVDNNIEAMRALLPIMNDTNVLYTARQAAAAVTLLDIILPLTYYYNNERLTSAVCDVIDALLHVPFNVIKTSKTANRIMRVLELLVENVQLNTTTCFTVERTNFELMAKAVTWVEHDNGLIFAPTHAITRGYIKLPAEVFERDILIDRVGFIAFRDDKLFDGSDSSALKVVIGSRVQSLRSCVHYDLPSPQISKRQRCVFWDKVAGSWSADGVSTLSIRGPVTSCCSSHLTSFSVSVNPDLSAVNGVAEEVRLLLATTVGLSIAVAIYSFVLICYCAIRSVNKCQLWQTILLLNTALLLSHAFLLAGRNRAILASYIACSCVGMLAFYCEGAVFLALAMYVRHVMNDVRRNDHVHSRGYVVKEFLLTYGVPVLPVTVAALVDLDAFSRDPTICRLSNLVLYVTPMSGFLIINVVVFVLVVRSSRRKLYTRADLRIRGTLVLMLLSTLTWLYDVISSQYYLGSFTIYFAYGHIALVISLAFYSLAFFCWMRAAMFCRSHKSLAQAHDGGLAPSTIAHGKTLLTPVSSSWWSTANNDHVGSRLGNQCPTGLYHPRSPLHGYRTEA